MNCEWKKGVKAATPIVMGYLPIGVAFGVLATQQGLSVKDIFFMSLIVYAGSSQFIAAAMMATGADAISVISTTFLVNLRHLLMSASLSPYLQKISIRLQSLIAFGITDETFAVSGEHVRNSKASSGYFIGLHWTSHISWILATTLGGIFGSRIPDTKKWGLDYALSAMFIGLLLMQLKNKRDVFVSVCAGVLSSFFAVRIGENWNVILAAVIAATMGVIVEQWSNRPLSSSLE